MTILVFGQTGQVATELARHGGAAVTCLGRTDADLTDPDVLRRVIADHAPQAVINAAAYTAVDQAEAEPEIAKAVNAIAPGVMAEVCAVREIAFLHVSTDYVFDGSGTRAWRETDPVSPQNVYGRSKLTGEDAVRAAAGHHAILRTSWVFSAHGANFVKTMLRLSETRDQLDVVADQVGGPTPAADIAAALLRMAELMHSGKGGGTYHFAGHPSVSWADFAREIFRQSGRDVDVRDIETADWPTPAARPLNSRLDCAALETDFGIIPPDWRAGLSDVIKELQK